MGNKYYYITVLPIPDSGLADLTKLRRLLWSQDNEAQRARPPTEPVVLIRSALRNKVPYGPAPSALAERSSGSQTSLRSALRNEDLRSRPPNEAVPFGVAPLGLCALGRRQTRPYGPGLLRMQSFHRPLGRPLWGLWSQLSLNNIWYGVLFLLNIMNIEFHRLLL